MERLMAWSMRNPQTVLIGVLIVSILAAAQLSQLQVAISPQSLIIEGDPDQEFYEQTQATFGSDRITIVYIEDPRQTGDHSPGHRRDRSPPLRRKNPQPVQRSRNSRR